MREGFFFFRSFRDAIKHLPDADRLAIYEALSAYALDGVQPEDGTLTAAMLTLMIPVIDARAKKQEASAKNGAAGAEYGKRGGKRTPSEPLANPYDTPSEPLANPKLTPSQPLANPYLTPIDSESDSESGQGTRDKGQGTRDKGGSNAHARFTPPTSDEVRAYAQERGSKVDPERFVDFYTSKGWRVGREPMKDWRAAFRNWEKTERARSGTSISERVSIVDSWIGG